MSRGCRLSLRISQYGSFKWLCRHSSSINVYGFCPIYGQCHQSCSGPVLVGALIASITFFRAGVIDWKLAFKILTPTAIGSIAGSALAEYMPEQDIKLLITIAVLCAFLLIFSGLKKLIEKEFEEGVRFRYFEVLVLFAVGFWLGLIVLDGATYMLLALIAFIHLPLVKANAYKNLAILVTSAIALTSFSIKGEVNWEVGGLMALGSIAAD
ncbi:MAG: hypothetical protein B7X60_02230 [Polynucleobacter sp. 39-45-136]|nr:MAG: hypothetical protein B7X60_02230 [Polynucleobacter sp. 39-45-136]